MGIPLNHTFSMGFSIAHHPAIGVHPFMDTSISTLRRAITLQFRITLQAFSTVSALIVSLLIMIVGSGSAQEVDDLGVLVAELARPSIIFQVRLGK